MALDIVEPVRPEVECFVLDLPAHRTFTKSDLAQLPSGHCRLMAPLTHELCEQLSRLHSLVAPVAEKVAEKVAEARGGSPAPSETRSPARTYVGGDAVCTWIGNAW